MSLRSLAAVAVGAIMAVAPLVASPAVATAAPTAPTAVRTITISGGGEYASLVPQAAQIWNSKVPNIRMVQTSTRGNITITVGSGGGSRATIGHGSGQIYLDRSQINQGYLALRVVTHELGHSLGLRDNYNGNCAILMSGGSAGTGCRNVNPSTSEANWVNQSFANGRVAVSAGHEVAVEWSSCWPAATETRLHGRTYAHAS